MPHHFIVQVPDDTDGEALAAQLAATEGRVQFVVHDPDSDGSTTTALDAVLVGHTSPDDLLSGIEVVLLPQVPAPYDEPEQVQP